MCYMFVCFRFMYKRIFSAGFLSAFFEPWLKLPEVCMLAGRVIIWLRSFVFTWKKEHFSPVKEMAALEPLTEQSVQFMIKCLDVSDYCMGIGSLNMNGTIFVWAIDWWITSIYLLWLFSWFAAIRILHSDVSRHHCGSRKRTAERIMPAIANFIWERNGNQI